MDLTGPTGLVGSPDETALSLPRAPARRPTGPLAALLRVYPALGNPAFRLLWVGMLPSTVAWQVGAVAIPYAAFQLEGSATVLGVVSLANGLPMLLLSLVGGVAADRLPRRRLLISTQSALGLAAGAMAVLALIGALEVWHLIALGIIQGIASAFNMPTRQAYIGDVIGPALLRNAVALNNAGLNCARIVGPALAGLLLAVPRVGVGGAFIAMATMYGLVLMSLFRLPARPAGNGVSPPGQPGGRPSAWAHLLEGLGYIRASPALLTLLGMAFLVLFFGMPYQPLLPLFSERVFGVGGAGLGIMMAAIGVGALSGSLAVAALAQSPHPTMLQLGFGVGFGLALVGFALAPAFPLAVAALAAVGFLSSAYTALNNTLVMANTEPRLYGRVMSVYLLTFAMMPFGALPMAWLADHLGGRYAVAGAGLVVAAAVAGVALLYPPYRRIR